MITIFSSLVPVSVPFADNVQRNAIQSWMALDLPCEIILLGDDEGTAEIAAEYGIRHHPDIPYHENRLPFVGPLFARAQEIATFDLMMYINSDIILISDFVSTLHKIVEYYKNRTRSFLAVGRRTDLILTERLDFNDPDWETSLREEVKQYGQLATVLMLDYFIFQKGSWPGKIPTFTLGANNLDTYLLGSALASRDMDVIDSTEGITAIQQEYYDRKDNTFVFRILKSPEAERLKNLYFRGFYFIIDYKFGTDHANLKYTSNGIRKRPFKLYDIKLFISIYGPAKYPQWKPVFKTVWSTWLYLKWNPIFKTVWSTWLYLQPKPRYNHTYNRILRRLLRWAGWGYL